MRLFIDTNLFLRYFTKDNQEMYETVEKILLCVLHSEIRIATSTIVLTEIMYTLQSFYKCDQKTIQKHVDSILQIANLVLIDETNFRRAYEYHKKKKVKISDCLIVTQVPEKYKLCSFDEELKNIIGKSRFISPEEVIKDS